MILDSQTLWADNLAHDGSPTELDLGAIKPGPGQPIRCFIVGSADLAGVTGVDVLDAAASPADEALMSVVDDPAGQLIEFELPSNTQQFVTIALAGTSSAGTYTAGIVLCGNQTNT